MTAPEGQNGLRETLARVSVLAAFPGLKDRIIAAFGRAAWVDNPGISVHGSADGGRLAMNHSGWAALPALLDEALAPVASLIATRDAQHRASLRAAEAELEEERQESARLALAVTEGQAEIARLKEGMERIASFPENYDNDGQSWGVGYAFYAVRKIARATLSPKEQP